MLIENTTKTGNERLDLALIKIDNQRIKLDEFKERDQTRVNQIVTTNSNMNELMQLVFDLRTQVQALTKENNELINELSEKDKTIERMQYSSDVGEDAIRIVEKVLQNKRDIR